MEIKVLEWRAAPWRRKVGRVLVKYGDLVLRLEILTYRDIQLWVSMPEIKFKGDKKLKLAYWEERPISDAFQQEVLRQLYQLAGKEVDIAWKLVKAAARNKKANTSGQD